MDIKEDRIAKLIKVFENDYPNLSINDKVRFIDNSAGNEYVELYWYYKRIRAEELEKSFSEILKGYSYKDAIKEVKNYCLVLEQKAMDKEL